MSRGEATVECCCSCQNLSIDKKILNGQGLPLQPGSIKVAVPGALVFWWRSKMVAEVHCRICRSIIQIHTGPMPRLHIVSQGAKREGFAHNYKRVPIETAVPLPLRKYFTLSETHITATSSLSDLQSASGENEGSTNKPHLESVWTHDSDMELMFTSTNPMIVGSLTPNTGYPYVEN